jgi:hypothetical protein
MMRIYLRWWTKDQPQAPALMAGEAAAKAAVIGKFPRAYFGDWQSTKNSPSAFALSGIDNQMFAWADGQAHGQNSDPVADLLRAA